MAVILVAEDNPGLRRLVRIALEMAGHDVLAVPDGILALRHLRLGEPVDLLLADHRMPGLTGIETIERAIARAPGLPCVLTTGDEVVGRDAVLLARLGAGMVRKPFSVEELLDAVREGLGATPVVGRATPLAHGPRPRR